MKKNKQLVGKHTVVAFGLMVFGVLCVCVLAGMLISKEIVPEEMGPVISAAMSELVVLLLCCITARTMPQSRLPAAMILAGGFAAFRLLAGTILFPEAELRLIGCLVTLVMGVAAGLMASTKKQRRR